MTSSELEDLAEALLLKLRVKPSRRFLLQRLAEGFGAEVSTVTKAFAVLDSWGYRFYSGSDKTDVSGWRQFRLAPDALLPTELSYKLKTESFGAVVHAYSSVKSTNTIAAKLASDGAPEGALVIAETQSAGRGRLGRSWHSPAGVGAYMSLILRPKIQPAQAPALSLVAGIALAEAIEKQSDLHAQIKWPNDVLLGKRKTAGILTELQTDGDKVSSVIVGVGININQTREVFPTELREKATSLRIQSRRKVDRVTLVQEFLKRFERRYAEFLKGGFAKLRKRACDRSSLMGKQVIVTTSAKKQSYGRVVDIDEFGRLIVETEVGLVALLSGEVSLAENY